MTKGPVVWFDKEEEYLKYLQQLSQHLSDRYMDLYKITHAKQTKLRLPAIVLSSFSGVASFGSSSFPADYQKYVSIVVGLINITIAMIQTYESYLKISDTVSKALTVATNLKKLADDIHCEMYIPIEDRETNGITFLRDAFSRYGAIIYQAPPLEDADIEKEKIEEIVKKISGEIKKHNKATRIEHGLSGMIEPITPSPMRMVRDRGDKDKDNKELSTMMAMNNESRKMFEEIRSMRQSQAQFSNMGMGMATGNNNSVVGSALGAGSNTLGQQLLRVNTIANTNANSVSTDNVAIDIKK
jgi:hypothetical protein